MAVEIIPNPRVLGPTGPTGPTGAAGAAGAAGATGPTGAAGGANIAIFTNQQNANTAGGGITASASWQALTINTTQYNGISGSSLATNTVTLPSGTYWYQGKVTFYGQLYSAKVLLRNTTDASDTIIGFSTETVTSTNSNLCICEGVFTIAAQKDFQCQYRVEVGKSGDGQGFQNNLGVVEVYSSHMFMKVG